MADWAAASVPMADFDAPVPARLRRPGTAAPALGVLSGRCTSGRHTSGRPGHELSQPTGGASRPHSVLLNSAIAIDIIVRPITATMARESPIGTTQLPQVMPGATRWMYSWGMSR